MNLEVLTLISMAFVSVAFVLSVSVPPPNVEPIRSVYLSIVALLVSLAIRIWLFASWRRGLAQKGIPTLALYALACTIVLVLLFVANCAIYWFHPQVNMLKHVERHPPFTVVKWTLLSGLLLACSVYIVDRCMHGRPGTLHLWAVAEGASPAPGEVLRVAYENVCLFVYAVYSLLVTWQPPSAPVANLWICDVLLHSGFTVYAVCFWVGAAGYNMHRSLQIVGAVACLTNAIVMPMYSEGRRFALTCGLVWLKHVLGSPREGFNCLELR